MQKKILKTLSVLLVGVSLISYGTVVKAAVSDVTTVEDGEVLKNKEIYFEILIRAQRYLDIKAKYESDTIDINALALNVWTTHLNDIYNDIFNRLDNSKRKDLENSQNQWYSSAEAQAREEAVKKGDDSEYVAYMAKATKERCFELVSTYLE